MRLSFISDCGAPGNGGNCDAAVANFYTIAKAEEDARDARYGFQPGYSLGRIAYELDMTSGRGVDSWYVFTKPFALHRPMRIVGDSGQHGYGTICEFRNYQDTNGVWHGSGFEVQRANMSVDGCQGDSSSLEYLAIVGSQLPCTRWTPNTQYAVGDILMLPGENRWYFECASAGRSGAQFAPYPTGGHFSIDVTVVDSGGQPWIVRVHAGVLMRARATVRDCFVGAQANNPIIGSGFTNAGIHVQSDGELPGNANGWMVEHSRIFRCGEGLIVCGGETQAGCSLVLDIQDAGKNSPAPSIGVGIWDSSFLGSTHIASQVAGCAGPGSAYIMDALGSRAIVFGCYAENDNAPSRVLGYNWLIGGTQPQGASVDSTGTVMLGYQWFGIAFQDPITGVQFYPVPRGVGALFSFKNVGERQPAYFSGHPMVQNGYGFVYGNANRTLAWRMGDEQSPEGPGIVSAVSVLRGGLIDGVLADVNNTNLRGGKRLVGDVFVGIGAPAGYRGLMVSVAGWKGYSWRPNFAYTVGGVDGIVPNVVEPGDGHCYQCTVAGVGGAQPPAWPGPNSPPFQDGTAMLQWVGPAAILVGY